MSRSLVAVCFVVASLLSAQVATDTAIRGLVTDSTGAAVPAATVVIRNVDTGENRSTTTDGSGSYSFPSLVPGKYNISAAHAGFKKEEITNRVAQVSQTAQVDFVLQVGLVTEKVTVSAAGAELLSTSNSEIAATINSRLTEELPLQGRNFFDAAVNLPHVSLQDLGPQISFAGSSQNQVLGSNTANPFFRSSGIFAAGNRDSATNVSVDGVNVQSSVYRQTTPQQPPSAIQEVKVHVSGMPAEFGNGAAAVSVITKSGSNEIHGQLYEYIRNNVTDASNYFNNLNNAPKNPIRTNQFGAAAGGPIIRNKLFIFGAYEGLRFRQSVFTTITRPPQSIENGDFSSYRPSASAAVPVIYDPSNYNPANGLRVPFPGNIIPSNRLDPVAAKFDQLYLPASTSTLEGIQQFSGSNKQILNSDQGVMRVDYALSERDRIYGRYGRVYSPTFNHTLESLAGILQNASDQNAGIHWTRILSAGSVNDFMVGYARPNWAYGKDVSAPDAAAAIGLVNASLLGGGPGFSNTGFSMNSSVSSYLNGTDNVYQLGDDITLVHGRHNFKFGVQLSDRRFYYPTQANDKGSFSFSPVYTAACPDGNTPCASARSAVGLAAGGNAFASYLIGAPVSILFQLNNGAYRGLQLYTGAYAQDSWRISSRLTVNYGIRYEHWTPWHVPRHTVDTFNEATGQIEYVLQNPLDYLDPAKNYGKSAPTNPNVPPDAYRTSTLNFAPRFGLAYSLTRNTVFRTGYGIYFDGNSNTNQLSQISEGAGPFNLRYQPQASTNEQVPSLHLNGNFPFPSPTAIPQPNSTPLSTFRFVPTYDPPSSVQEWSASLQQRIGSDWGAEISYQGTHAVHLPQFVDVNPPALPQGTLANLSIDARRKFPYYGILGSWKPIGYGRYNGIAASIRNTGWHGLTLISSFTFAKNITSSILGLSDQGNQDANFPYLWRGSARLTPRLRFVNSFSYDLPLASKNWAGGRNRYVAAVVGGWRISGIQDFTTGSWDYITTNDVSGTGYGTSPNRICDPRSVPGGRGRLQWFNTSCFANPVFGTFGNSPIGVFEDPPIDNLNTALLRTIKIPVHKDRKADLRFRADFFNVLNHTQFAPPNTATTQSGSTTFGRITSARPARSMQFSTSIFF